MSDLIRWFGEQSDTVKIAILGPVTAFVVGFWAALKEWKMPVLKAPAVATVTAANAPRSVDDPMMLMLNELAAMNVNLAALLALTKAAEADQDERIDKVVERIKDLTNELYLLRQSLNIRPIGA